MERDDIVAAFDNGLVIEYCEPGSVDWIDAEDCHIVETDYGVMMLAVGEFRVKSEG